MARFAPQWINRATREAAADSLEVDPPTCPSCDGPMRVVAFITQASVIDQILTTPTSTFPGISLGFLHGP